MYGTFARNLRRTLVLLAGLGTMLAVTCMAAHAGPADHDIVLGSVTIPPKNQGNAIAVCPAGKVATGGGFMNFDAFDSGTDVVIAASRPVGSGWQVIAFNPTTTSQTVMAFATCAPVSDRDILLGFITMASNDQGTATAKCPAGKIATGGGFMNFDAFDSGTDVTIAMTRPAGPDWQVIAFNPTTSSQSVAAFTACAPVTERNIIPAFVTMSPNSQGNVTANCPAGQVAIGGGFMNFDAFLTATDVVIAASRPVGSGWQVIAYNPTTTAQSVGAFASCADAPASPTDSAPERA
jgi:hypothetical protein